MPETTSIQRALRFRLELTPAQEQSLIRFAGARRWVWNWALEQRRQYYAETGKTLGVTPLCTRVTMLKREPGHAWLRGVNAQLLQQAIRDLDQAFCAFFQKRARYPRFKNKKRDKARFRIPQGVKLANSRVVLPGIGPIKFRQSREPLGAIKSATCKQDAAGHWYVTLVETTSGAQTPPTPPDPDRVVGLDRGLQDLIVGSDGLRVAAPRWYRQSEHKLRRANRALSRTKRDSPRRQKARRLLALLHLKVGNRRADFLHRLTNRLVWQYDSFCPEDLSTRGLARTKLAKSVLDAGWGDLGRQLQYKAAWAGKPLVKVDRWYPSSKICSACGWLLPELALAVRSWACPGCGVMQDRDLNAALNIPAEGLKMLAAGHADSRNARGAAVRPATGRRAA